jgi:hypothetical protein
LDGECAKCGALVTVATPLDHPDFQKGEKWKRLYSQF